MTLRLTYYGSVRDGVLKVSHRKRLDEEVKAFEGKRVEITIQRAKKSKSLQQGRYLWGCVYEYALQGFKDLGHQDLTKEDVHFFFKGRFLSNGKEVVDPSTGEVKRLENTTTDLTTTEMLEYIAQIVQFCAEFLSVVVPDPHEQIEMGI